MLSAEDKEAIADIERKLAVYIAILMKNGKVSELVKSITLDDNGDVRIELEDLYAKYAPGNVIEIGVELGTAPMKKPRRLALTKKYRRR